MTCGDSSLGSKAATLSRKLFGHSAFILATCIHSIFHAPAGSQGGSVAIMLSLKRLCSHRWWQHPRHNGKGHSLLGRCTSVATSCDTTLIPFHPFQQPWKIFPESPIQNGQGTSRWHLIRSLEPVELDGTLWLLEVLELATWQLFFWKKIIWWWM